MIWMCHGWMLKPQHGINMGIIIIYCHVVHVQGLVILNILYFPCIRSWSNPNYKWGGRCWFRPLHGDWVSHISNHHYESFFGWTNSLSSPSYQMKSTWRKSTLTKTCQPCLLLFIRPLTSYMYTQQCRNLQKCTVSLQPSIQFQLKVAGLSFQLTPLSYTKCTDFFQQTGGKLTWSWLTIKVILLMHDWASLPWTRLIVIWYGSCFKGTMGCYLGEACLKLLDTQSQKPRSKSFFDYIFIAKSLEALQRCCP
jgi:hypothetical protein